MNLGEAAAVVTVEASTLESETAALAQFMALRAW
jgi:hypothetical protein